MQQILVEVCMLPGIMFFLLRTTSLRIHCQTSCTSSLELEGQWGSALDRAQVDCGEIQSQQITKGVSILKTAEMKAWGRG